MKKFYVTTPIYYVNDIPHIGHAYTTIAADCMARFRRLSGMKVFFLTGTDEHGQKVEKSARSMNTTPQELADRVVVRFKKLWERLNISNDDFIRTTEERHIRAATELWRRVAEKGDIYLGEYEDWYCTPCESFLTESQLVEGKCPDCGREVEKLREPSYFFRLSKYEKPLLDYIENNPDFIQPDNRRNEIVSFIRQGLKDLSISRTSFSWGIPVPDDPKHVMYVWFDALTNYLTADGWPDRSEFWPADLHLIGKDILRFHTIYWPAFLMSAGIEPPRKVFAHGWWTVEGEKMSKSRGNVVDPFEMADRFGVDQFRYFLLREVPFGLDGDFSVRALKGRINGELANELGNLLSRTVSMIIRYHKGSVPGPNPVKLRPELESKMVALLDVNSKDSVYRDMEASIDRVAFHEALSAVWKAIREMNTFVDRAQPWSEKDSAQRATTLYILAEGLRIVALYLYPFMPASSERIWHALGIEKGIETIEKAPDVSIRQAAGWGGLSPGTKVKKTAPLFPRIE